MCVSTDLESQSSGVRAHSRRLDAFLIASVIALFVMFAAALGGALLFARQVKAELSARPEANSISGGDTRILHKPPGDLGYKTQISAYLRASESELNNTVMKWEPINYGHGQSVGTSYSFDRIQSVLDVTQSGNYFLYVQLTFSCTNVCSAGQVQVQFDTGEEKGTLTCKVSLPKTNESVTRTCWRVVMLKKNTRLLAKSQLLTDSLENWKLDLNGSGFGIFLVDLFRPA